MLPQESAIQGLQYHGFEFCHYVSDYPNTESSWEKDQVSAILRHPDGRVYRVDMAGDIHLTLVPIKPINHSK